MSTATGMNIIGFTVASHYRRNNVHTVSEMVQLIYGRKSGNISAIAFLFACVVLAFVQLQTCSSVVATLFSSLHQRLVDLGSHENLWNPFSGGLSYAWLLIIGGVPGGMSGLQRDRNNGCHSGTDCQAGRFLNFGMKQYHSNR